VRRNKGARACVVEKGAGMADEPAEGLPGAEAQKPPDFLGKRRLLEELHELAREDTDWVPEKIESTRQRLREILADIGRD
jgi:hypothetical protein